MPSKTPTLDSKDLLHTKLEIPVLPNRIVRRGRLTSLLQKPGEAKITLLTAPAGYGKTTLIGEWLSGVSAFPARTAWVSLDLFDNAPYRFWAYIIGAIRKGTPQIEFNPSDLLAHGYDPSDFTKLDPLINEIGRLPFFLNLILDDYHHINSAPIHQSLAYLFHHQPRNLNIIIASRTTPPLALSRLRSLGRLNEIGLNDLSFSIDETRVYLSDLFKSEPSPKLISEIYQITEGWIAGLQFAALTYKNHKSIVAETFSDLIQTSDFPGYFAEEVLASQDAAAQDFLIKTSILNEFSPAICNNLLGIRTSQAIIDNLVANNLFIFQVDDRQTWYRYHPLFAKVLRKQFAKLDKAVTSALHQQALQWFLDNGYPDRAVVHALETGQNQKAAEIIDSLAMQAIINFDFSQLIHWISSLPDYLLELRPTLGIYQALSYFLLGQYELVAPILEKIDVLLQDRQKIADDNSRAQLSWQVQAIRTAIECIVGNYELGINNGLTLLEDEFQVNSYIYAMLVHAVGNATEMTGRLSDAINIYEKGRQFGLVNHYYYGAAHSSNNLAKVKMDQGCLNGAAGEYQQAINFAVKSKLDTAAVSLAQSGLLAIALQQNNVDLIESLAAEILANFEKTISSESVWVRYAEHGKAIAEYLIYRDELDRAESFLNDAAETYREYPGIISPYSYGILDLRFKLLRAKARKGVSTDWIFWSDAVNRPDILDSLASRIIQARVLVAQQRYAKAIPLIDQLAGQIRQSELGGRLIEINLLSALAYYAVGRKDTAFQSLEEALTLGKPEGYFRIFTDEGDLMKTLLADYLDSRPVKKSSEMGGYIRALLSALDLKKRQHLEDVPEKNTGVTSLHVLQETLSDREYEVLQMLMDGTPAKTIAQRLMISVNTANSHVKSIYRKLDVHSREMLISRSNELKLVE